MNDHTPEEIEDGKRIAALEKSLAETRAYCGRCAAALKQLVDLGNVNEATRKTLIHIGNGLNDTARAGK